MKNIFNKKSGRVNFYIGLTAISLAIVFICCLFGWLFKYKTDYVGAQYITSEAEFLAALENSSEIKKMKEYYLTEDITLTIDLLENKSYNFYGKLDGGEDRHSVTVTADDDPTTSDQWAASIFDTVMADAEICNIDFIVPAGMVVGGADCQDGTALIAKINSGYIHNCSVEISRIVIGANETRAAGMVVENYGKISDIEIVIDEVTESADGFSGNSIRAEKSWGCYFGGVAAINYGMISEIQAEIDFSELQVLHFQVEETIMIDMWFDNRWIGFICGLNAVGTKEENIYDIELKNSGSYWAIAADNDFYLPIFTN